MPRFARRFAAASLPFLLLLACAAPRALAATGQPDKIAPWVFANATLASPAEFLVVLADQADLAPAERIADRAGKARFVHDALYAKAQATQPPLLAWLDQRHVQYRSFYIVNAILVTATLDMAEALSARPDVARIDGNPVIQQITPVTLTPDELAAAAQAPDAVQAIEPGVTAIRAPEVWAMGATGQGIVVGTADTGVRWDHAALKAKYRGWDGSVAHHDYNWHDSIHSGGGTCGANTLAPCDDYGHGTHTIATAVGGDPSGTNQVGVAPGARFIACRNMDQGNGTPASYLECMEWFLAPYPVGGNTSQGDPAMAPDVTVNSWNCPADEGCAPATLLAGVAAQRAAGIMFVVAAGNSGPNCSTVSDPASFYDDAYSAGAFSASSGLIASFSSRGPVTADGSGRIKPDICAPGVSVRSANYSGTTGYVSFSGTSMATPHVAGAVALLWSARPGLRHDIATTESVLDAAATPVNSAQCDAGGIPNNVWGWGKLDIKAAVDATAPTAVPAPAAGADGVALAPAYPNPARGTTLLRFRLAREGALDLAVYSSSGQRVRTLAHGVYPAGERTLRWDGADERGRVAAPAMYHVRLSSAGTQASQKVIWLGR